MKVFAFENRMSSIPFGYNKKGCRVKKIYRQNEETGENAGPYSYLPFSP